MFQIFGPRKRPHQTNDEMYDAYHCYLSAGIHKFKIRYSYHENLPRVLSSRIRQTDLFILGLVHMLSAASVGVNCTLLAFSTCQGKHTVSYSEM